MDQQDSQQRIAELERELTQQKRIAELERQLADAKDAAGGGQPVEQPAERAGGTIKVGGQVVFQRCDPSDPVLLAPGVRAGYAAPRRKSGGIALAIVAVLGGVFGACVGVAAAVTAVIPSAALWMSPIVCRSGYDMAYNTSHYSYKPVQSGTSVSFQCVSNGDYYDLNDFAVFALQSLLTAVVLGVALAVGGLLWRRSH